MIARPPRQSDPDEMLDYLDELHRYLNQQYIIAEPAKGSDSTAVVQNAIDAMEDLGGGDVMLLPYTTYECQGLTVADNSKVRIIGSGPSSILQKNANGTIITLGKECTLRDCYLQGNGGSYTGAGVMISSGALELTSWRRILNCDIIDTASYGVEFSGQRAGYGSTVLDCKIQPVTLSVAAVKLPTVGSAEGNGNRHFILLHSFSNSLCEVADAENTVIVGCDGGIPTMNANSVKMVLKGNRLVNWTGAAAWTIQGTGHSIIGNAISLNAGTNAATFHSNCVGVRYKGNYGPEITFTDNAGGLTNGNDIDYGAVTYTPTWTADGVAPALGDGVITGAYWREGQHFRVNITFLPGSTTTFGTGAWHFSVPLTAARKTTGSALLTDTGTGFYAAVSRIADSASTVEIYGYNVANAVTSAIPFAWANTDVLTLDIVYPIT